MVLRRIYKRIINGMNHICAHERYNRRERKKESDVEREKEKRGSVFVPVGVRVYVGMFVHVRVCGCVWMGVCVGVCEWM